MQQDLSSKIMKFKEEDQTLPVYSNLPKRTFRYFIKHRILTSSEDLKKQTIKRTDTKNWNFQGDLKLERTKDQDVTILDTTVNRLARVLHSSKRVFRLKMVLKPLYWVNGRELLMLRKALKRHHSIRSFDFNFDSREHRYDLNDYDLKELGQSLKIFSSLQKINLSLSFNERMRQNILLKLFSSIRGLNSLQSLALRLGKISDEELVKLSRCIGRLGSLEKTDFSFGFKKISHQAWSALAHCHKGADALQSLDWSNHHNPIANFDIKRFNGTKSSSKPLSNYRLSFYPCLGNNFASLRSQEFVCYLKGLEPSQDQSFKLESYANLMTPGLKELNNIFEETQSFQHLKMKCFVREQDKKELKRLTENLKRFSCLTKLELSYILHWTKDANLLGLISEGLGELKSLKHVNWEWIGSPNQISDDDLKSFSQALRRLQSLESASLNFNCSEVTNQGFQDLKEALTELNLLQEMSLRFTELPRIDDTGIQQLAQGLETLPSLRSINLSFTLQLPNSQRMFVNKSPSKITNEGLKALGQSLKKISALQSVNLSFSGFNSVTSKELQKLRKSFKNLQCKVHHSK